MSEQSLRNDLTGPFNFLLNNRKLDLRFRLKIFTKFKYSEERCQQRSWLLKLKREAFLKLFYSCPGIQFKSMSEETRMRGLPRIARSAASVQKP